MLSLRSRAAGALVAYLAYGIAAWLVVPMVVTYTQAHGITTFYELAPDEAPGPLGDVDRALFDIKLEYGLFVVMLTPAFWWLRGPWWLYVVLFVCNEPLLLGGYVFFLRLTGH